MNQTSKELFGKAKSTSSIASHWINSHGWLFSIVFLAIIVVLSFDLMYSYTHFVEVYESISDRYTYSSSNTLSKRKRSSSKYPSSIDPVTWSKKSYAVLG